MFPHPNVTSETTVKVMSHLAPSSGESTPKTPSYRWSVKISEICGSCSDGSFNIGNRSIRTGDCTIKLPLRQCHLVMCLSGRQGETPPRMQPEILCPRVWMSMGIWRCYTTVTPVTTSSTAPRRKKALMVLSVAQWINAPVVLT